MFRDLIGGVPGGNVVSGIIGGCGQGGGLPLPTNHPLGPLQDLFDPSRAQREREQRERAERESLERQAREHQRLEREREERMQQERARLERERQEAMRREQERQLRFRQEEAVRQREHERQMHEQQERFAREQRAAEQAENRRREERLRADQQRQQAEQQEQQQREVAQQRADQARRADVAVELNAQRREQQAAQLVNSTGGAVALLLLGIALYRKNAGEQFSPTEILGLLILMTAIAVMASRTRTQILQLTNTGSPHAEHVAVVHAEDIARFPERRVTEHAEGLRRFGVNHFRAEANVYPVAARMNSNSL